DLNKRLGTGSPGHQTPGACKPVFSLFLGSLAHDRRLRSDSYDSQRPGVRECGGCEGRSTAPLHSRSVRGVELNCRSSTQIFASTTNLQHCDHGNRRAPTSSMNTTIPRICRERYRALTATVRCRCRDLRSRYRSAVRL